MFVPWMVSLSRAGQQICGGSLVRQGVEVSWVLTAAHCVETLTRTELPEMQARAGALSFKEKKSPVCRIRKVYLDQRRYSGRNFIWKWYDVALLAVQRIDGQTPSGQTSSIPSSSDPETSNQVCQCYGYGMTFENENRFRSCTKILTAKNPLKRVEVTTLSARYCNTSKFQQTGRIYKPSTEHPPKGRCKFNLQRLTKAAKVRS